MDHLITNDIRINQRIMKFAKFGTCYFDVGHKLITMLINPFQLDLCYLIS